MRKSRSRAAQGLEDFRAALAAENPRFAAGVELEEAADAFCDAVRNMLWSRRREAKLDQAGIAREMSLTQSAVSRIERGRGDIGLKTIFRYARALGLVPALSLGSVSDSAEADEEATAPVVTTLSELKTHIEEVMEVLQAAEGNVAHSDKETVSL